MEPVTHDMLPPRLCLDYDLDSETRGVEYIAPILTPSLLSGLVGNICGLKKPEIPTQPTPFEAGDSMGGHGWIPLKSEAPGPSHNAGVVPQTPASKCEPPDQGTSQCDQLVFEVNPEDAVEVIVSDDNDLDLTLEEPQAISMQSLNQLLIGSKAPMTRIHPRLPPGNTQPKRKA